MAWTACAGRHWLHALWVTTDALQKKKGCLGREAEAVGVAHDLQLHASLADTDLKSTVWS